MKTLDEILEHEARCCLSKEITDKLLSNNVYHYQALAIIDLILKELPKERFLLAGNVEANKGYNQCRDDFIAKIKNLAGGGNVRK